MTSSIWDECAVLLQQELSAQQYNTWIRPLTAEHEGHEFCLIAPNRFVMDWINQKFIHRIHELVNHVCTQADQAVPDVIAVKVAGRQQPAFQSGSSSRSYNSPSSNSTHSGSVSGSVSGSDNGFEQPNNQAERYGAQAPSAPADSHRHGQVNHEPPAHSPAPPRVHRHTQPSFEQSPNQQYINKAPKAQQDFEGGLKHRNGLNKDFTFESFVEGKSNQLGLAAAQQIVENPGESYNPLFIYGGVGLGKTHLMHAVGNGMLARNPNAKIVYLHSERFVADMVKALQLNAINDFKRYYRSVDALLIDDIQFFAGKDRSQEEFFHTFNALLEGNQQIILTCDRYPKVISNVEERLKSRFGWGLTVEVEPPELETRVAILMKRAEKVNIDLPHDAAFFIAQRIRSNVRELEGALKRVVANSSFTNRPISVDLVREALKDLLALQDKQVSITNIQRVTGEYYKIKVAEFTSKRRSRSVARPRQMAMALSKELTNHSLPEIGDDFGGRDHTTVLHACRKIKELIAVDAEIEQDWINLQRLLTT